MQLPIPEFQNGGIGLGLTIARNIVESHGGTLVLRNHPDGGLEAILQQAVAAPVRPAVVVRNA